MASLPPPKPDQTQASTPPDERLELLTEQIKLTRKALNASDLEPKDRAQLVRALCGLLDQQRIAKGEPLPGSKRPAPERATKAREAGAWLALSDPAPLALAETPTPARPLGWEYEDPNAAPAPGPVMPGPSPDPVPPAV